MLLTIGTILTILFLDAITGGLLLFALLQSGGDLSVDDLQLSFKQVTEQADIGLFSAASNEVKLPASCSGSGSVLQLQGLAQDP